MDIISINPHQRRTTECSNTGKIPGIKKIGGFHREGVKTIQVLPDTTIREAMKLMDSSSLETILVIDEGKKLLGLVTDGDIRRSILNSMESSDKIGKIMNRNFTALHYSKPFEDIVNTMKKYCFKQIPLVDDNKRVIDIVLLRDIITDDYRDNYVVLMAGGTGSRLKPLTNAMPKPMLKVGDKPILEIIINQFKSQGFKNFIISISYLADIVEGYFGDGSNYGVNIKYIRETKRLGTAGCIRHAEPYLDKPFYVMNGDLLTRINFEDMLNYHAENEFDITMGLRKYEYQIPYGVMETQGDCITGLVEKPVVSCTINAGVYCLDPKIIGLIPEDEHFDITTLVEKCIQKGAMVGGYDINDYWIDIGQIEEYNKANMDYGFVFEEGNALRGNYKRAYEYR